MAEETKFSFCHKEEKANRLQLTYYNKMRKLLKMPEKTGTHHCAFGWDIDTICGKSITVTLSLSLIIKLNSLKSQ